MVDMWLLRRASNQVVRNSQQVSVGEFAARDEVLIDVELKKLFF